MKVLFLSHKPHHSHLAFAKSIHARVELLPFDGYITLVKRWRPLGAIYPIIAAVWSLFIPIREHIVFVDGGTALYVATFLKIRKPKLKIVYLDGDLFFYNMTKQPSVTGKWVAQKIDAALSESKLSKKYLQHFIQVAGDVVHPYPQELTHGKQITRMKGTAVYVGRLDPEKSIQRVITFVINNPHISMLTIVGEGAQSNMVQQFARTNDKIRYVGYHKKPSLFYQRAEYFIHLPDFDPFAVTPLEAVAAGCTPILSRGVGCSSLFPQAYILAHLTQKSFDMTIGRLMREKPEIPQIQITEATQIRAFTRTFQRIVNALM